KNTFVLFTSDNGGTPRAMNSPLRGNKGSTWEGGMRVPTIAWWPGKIAGGSVTSAMTSMMDILPTFAAVADAKLPERKYDGVNLWPLLAGQVPNVRDTFYFFRGLRLEAVRSGNWKLQLVSGENAKPKAKGRTPKVAAASREGLPRLYDLDTDIGETTNVADKHPEVVTRLQALVAAMNNDLGADAIGPGCRELGRVAQPQPLIASDGTIREGFAGEKKKLP
ncbi:MAG: sulfatase-like hydrolase/transferase, partial [Roseimicrobium sp.]